MFLVVSVAVSSVTIHPATFSRSEERTLAEASPYMRSSMPTQARAVACLTLLASADGIRIPGMGPGKGSGKGPGRGGGKIGSMVATSFGASEPRKSFPAMYNALLAEFPYQTKAIGTGITYIFSDSTAQLLERDDGRTPSERIARSLKFGAVGALWVGPLLAGWFQLMDSAMPGKTLRPVMAKLLADQMLQGPFMIGTMFWWTSISNGATLAEARQKIEQHLWRERSAPALD